MRHGLNIVAIGGGTGLSTLLRGLKTYGYLGEKGGNFAHFEQGGVAPVKAGLRFYLKGTRGTEGEPEGNAA